MGGGGVRHYKKIKKTTSEIFSSFFQNQLKRKQNIFVDMAFAH
jgi:hypothetical protein